MRPSFDSQRIAASENGHGVDPRACVLATLVFGLAVSLMASLPVLAVACCFAFALMCRFEQSVGRFVRTFRPFFFFVAAMVAILPWTVTDGSPTLWSVGPVSYSQGGVLLATMVAMKGLAILMTCWALLHPLGLIALGGALERLGMPNRLVRLLYFVVRYLAVLTDEHERMRRAMRARGFHPTANRRTYRAYANLAGMLLVRALDRSERILAAMRSRGFRGRFPSARSLHFGWKAGMFLLFVTSVASGLLVADCWLR